MSFLLPGDTIGEHTVRRVLGSGVTAVVYQVQPKEGGGDLALKLLNEGFAPELLDELRARFEREVEIGRRLSHPGLACATQIATHDGRPYLLMALAEGTPLSRLIGDEPWTVATSLAIVSAAGTPLAHAHQRSVVHRDVKPGNIVVSMDGSGEPTGACLIDFGLARGPASVPLTRPGGPIGAMGFAAPEELRGIDAGPRTDVFSLGVVAYLLLTGRRPFAGKEPADYEAALLRGPPPAPSALTVNVGQALDAVILRCLELDPRQRFDNSAAFVAALRACER